MLICSHLDQTTTWQDPRKAILQMNQAPASPLPVPPQPQPPQQQQQQQNVMAQASGKVTV